jgi:hypothetical protein
MALPDPHTRHLRQPKLFPETELRKIYSVRVGNASFVRREPAAAVAHTLCATCHEREARYGFATPDHAERPRTLCFECFRLALERRQQPATRRDEALDETALANTLEALAVRRHRAQIAARRAMFSEPAPDATGRTATVRRAEQNALGSSSPRGLMCQERLP